MKILITGIKGFIGSRIQRAVESSYKIIGIDILPQDEKDKHYSQIDISNFTQLEEYIKKNNDIKIIIHAAALAHNKGTDLSYDKFKRINFDGTKNLIDISNRHLDLNRFIFFSTISVYGEQLRKSIYHENDERKCSSPYAVTKMYAEDYLFNHAEFKFTILRFAPVYSNEFMLNIDRRTKIRKLIFQVGKADNKLSLLNINNIITVIKVLLKTPDDFVNEVFNLADKKIYSFKDLIEVQKKITGIKTIIRIPGLFLYLIYIIGILSKVDFLIENSIKLISDNTYDTSKIESKMSFYHELNELVD